MNVRELIKLILPPLFVPIGRRLLGILEQRKPEWEYVPTGWEREQFDPAIKGWNVESILKAYQTKWPGFLESLEGTQPLGISPEAEPSSHESLILHNIMMSYAYVFALATRAKSSIAMLDWGGGIGHYYWISRTLVPEIEIDYHCKDVPLLAEYGRQILPQGHFYTDDSCLTRQYDFILVSGSLQFSRDWVVTLQSLAKATASYIYVANLPIVENAPSFVFVQRPYRFGYKTEYLGWVLNRQEFLECSRESGLRLIREFIMGHCPIIHRAPEQNEYRGFLFCSTRA